MVRATAWWNNLFSFCASRWRHPILIALVLMTDLGLAPGYHPWWLSNLGELSCQWQCGLLRLNLGQVRIPLDLSPLVFTSHLSIFLGQLLKKHSSFRCNLRLVGCEVPLAWNAGYGTVVSLELAACIRTNGHLRWVMVKWFRTISVYFWEHVKLGTIWGSATTEHLRCH